jgi:transposase-like protein
VGKDTVSRVWRKVKSDWEAWNARSLAEEPIVRLILDGTVVRVRLDREATSISLLVVIGVRADGQKLLLAIKSMGGESTEAWRTVLDDLIQRGLRRPEFLIVDDADIGWTVQSIRHGDLAGAVRAGHVRRPRRSRGCARSRASSQRARAEAL